jgi:predicted CXXCH cytochrome family protein
MHSDGPVTRLSKCAAPGFWPGLRVFLMLTLGAGILCFTALAAPAPQEKAAATPAKEAAPAATFVGSDTCATCHDQVAKDFASNPHTKMAEMHGSNGATCENCHGAGSEHVAGGGDITKIFNPMKHSPKEVDEKCLSCHAGVHPNFIRSPHARAGLSCISCHTVHGVNTQKPLEASSKLFAADSTTTSARDKELLLRAPQPTLCYSCHADQKAQFNMPIHHKVNEGLVKCTDCHDVHGTFLQNNLRSTEDQNQICTKCHTDVRGPFTYEHAAVRAEGCVTCHTPHGSQNPRLLNMPSIATLCNQCHSPLSAGGVHGLDQGSTTVTPCVTCHTMIHGSNVSPAFTR